MQLRARHIARNVLFNWFGTAANMAVGFFLSPFVLHRLGNVVFGVWTLAVSAVGYMALLDLGMQNSVLRFVSQGHIRKDHQSASETISAALWVRIQISGLIVVLSAILAAIFPFVFKIAPDLVGDARKAIMLIGATTAISMSVGVVGGVLSALNRYDLQNYIGLLQTAIRVTGAVIVLRRGHGIVAIGLTELAAVLISSLVVIWVARRLYPELQMKLNKPKTETLKKIWSYSSYVFLTSVAVLLVYQTDNLIVGAFISTTAVTFYAIANSLCRYVTQVVGSMANTFMPAASTYDAAGDAAGLLMLYKNGTRATLMVSLPVMITLILRGPAFIGLWMGPQYSRDSGTVLIILGIPLIFAFSNRTATAIAFGVEKHKTSAQWAIGEGIANLILSVVLVQRYGIYGVAIGTMIPSLFAQLVLWPGYVSKLVGLSRSEVMWKIWAPMFLSSIPFAVATYAVGALFPARNLPIFIFQVLATLPIFVITIGLVFRAYVRNQILPRFRSLFFAEARI